MTRQVEDKDKTKFDDTGTYCYIGSALSNSAISAAVWHIERVTNATGNVDMVGVYYDQIWDNRASLTYN